MYARESAEFNKHGEITHDVNDRQRRNFERSKKGDSTDGDDQKESIYGDSNGENSDRDKKRNVQEILGDDLEMSQHTLQTTAELRKGSVKGQKRRTSEDHVQWTRTSTVTGLFWEETPVATNRNTTTKLRMLKCL